MDSSGRAAPRGKRRCLSLHEGWLDINSLVWSAWGKLAYNSNGSQSPNERYQRLDAAARTV